jgi:GT2 family glycosyltransferase
MAGKFLDEEKDMKGENMNIPKVTILLLNYNGWKDAIECLESVYKITYPNWEVLLVDNGSVDGSVTKIKEWAAGEITVESKFFEYDAERKPIEYIEELFYDEEEARVKVSEKEKEGDKLLPHQKLSILRIEKNRGFTGGNNIGIEYILREKKADYILLLSNDTVVDKYLLKELVKVAESAPEIGVVGPKVYYYDYNGRKDIINFAGGKINLWKGECYHIGAGEIDTGRCDRIREVDYVEGSCVLIKKEVIEEVGMLDHEYFAYWEEADWCVRAKKAGYGVLYVPKAEIWHKGLSTTRKTSGFVEYHMTRNMFWFMKQHTTRRQYLSFLVYFFGFRFWFISAIHLIYDKNVNAFISFFRGVMDGIKKVHQ